jgi:hypothetical protein
MGYVVLGVENLSLVFSAHLQPLLFEEGNETISGHGSQFNRKDENFHQHPKLHDQIMASQCAVVLSVS